MTYKIGIDLGGTFVRAGLVKDNYLLKKSKLRLKNPKADIIQVISDIFDKRVKSIGIGAPGPLDSKKGLILNPRNLNLKKVNLKKIIEQKFERKTKLSNDANCFALAETIYGAAKGYNNVIGVILGTGLGAGIIIDSKIYTGNSDSAGEIGNITYKDSILEKYCNAGFLKSKFGKDPINLNNKKDFSEFAKNVAFALSILINTFDPEIIVFGGGLSNKYSLFIDGIKKELKKRVSPTCFRKLKISKSKLDDSGIIGASLLTD